MRPCPGGHMCPPVIISMMSSRMTPSAPVTPAAARGGGASGPREWWRGLPPRRRRLLRVLLCLGVIVVLGVSALLARFLSAENAERNDIVLLLQAQARGDIQGMLDQISGCRRSPLCVAAVKANASNPRVRRAGAVKLLQLESPTASSLGASTGMTRVAWTVIGTLPVVQCVEVRRTGNFLTGIHVRLLGLSAPIAGEGVCHKRTANEIEEEEATAVER